MNQIQSRQTCQNGGHGDEQNLASSHGFLALVGTEPFSSIRYLLFEVSVGSIKFHTFPPVMDTLLNCYNLCMFMAQKYMINEYLYQMFCSKFELFVIKYILLIN